MDGMQIPLGTTECNHSYYTGNSFSVPHSAQQLQHGTPSSPAQPPASIQEVNAPASSGAISSSLFFFSSQVTEAPTRNSTGGVMPLAEAITQLSFFEFLQRCGIPIAPPQASQLPVPISLLDAAVQTTPPCDVSHQVSTQTSVQQDTLSCDVAVQTSFYGAHTLSLDAAAQTTSPSTLSQHVSTQMGSRSASSFSVDTSVQTPIRCVVLHDAATQLPLTEFFIGCIYSNSPLDRQNPVRQSPPPMQGSHASPQPPPGLEQPVPPPELAAYSHLFTTHGAYVNSSSSHAQQSPVSTTQVGTHPVRTASSAKRSASTALAGTHNPIGSNLRTDTGLFPKPRAVVLPMVSGPFPKPRALVLPLVHFGQSKPEGHSGIDTADSDLMHHQFRLSLLQWNPGPARRNPTNIVSAACGRFHAVILQEASDHVPHISDQFRVYTDNTDLAILLNKDTFEPDPTVLTFKVDSTSKSTWGMVLLIVRGLLRRPSLSGTPTVTFCSVHIHNVVAKKRDASTELLQRLHEYMLEHNVDFIGGDFNVSAFSTVSDVFTDDEFSAPGNSLLLFFSCQSDLTSGVCIHMAATSLTMQRLALDPGINLLTSLCFSTFATPIFLDPAVLCAVSKHNKEGMIANIIKLSVPRNDARDHAPGRQGVRDDSRSFEAF